jgi:putative transcriptional regulator
MEQDLIDFRKKFGLRIEELRIKKGISQIHLAAIMGGRDKQTVNRYIKQGANPSAYIVWQLSKALEVSIDELFKFPK